MQLWPDPQVTHWLPPLPHWSALGVTQVLLTQQPVGHVDASQVGATQRPLLHDCPDEHALHCAPSPPHDAGELPGRHTLPSQHPVGQLVALHEAAVHAPLVHMRPLPHTLHWAPFAPHAALLAPGTHTLPWQQPPGHVVPLQVVASHRPRLHT